MLKKIKIMLKFENLTYAPIDKSLIIKKLLNKKEIVGLNQYHKTVFKKLKKYMSKNELILLKILLKYLIIYTTHFLNKFYF